MKSREHEILRVNCNVLAIVITIKKVTINPFEVFIIQDLINTALENGKRES